MNNLNGLIQTVSFQGEPGAYSETAALDFFGEDIQTQPCMSFEAVFANVNETVTTYGIVPIENSLAGSIHRNYDLLIRNNLHIIGELHLRISHCLLALPGVTIDQIKQVHSHPQALAQCEGSINKFGFTPVVEADTAGSARMLKEGKINNSGVLASKRAAEVYGLNILAENFEDNPANFTRFLALSREELKISQPGNEEYKTSIVFSLDNKPGVLFKALSVFALREIDLTKIESRPIPGLLWEYLFYIDFIGHVSTPTIERALDHLKELSTYQRVLGSYPRHHLTID